MTQQTKRTFLPSAWIWSMTVLVAALLTGCSSHKEASPDEAQLLMAQATKARDYKHILVLADSLASAKVITEGESFFWQGFAYYRLMQRRTAEFCWKESMSVTKDSADPDELAIYARSASYLASSYIRYLNFASAQKVVKVALERLDKAHFNANSDYTNLLIFAGCCQAHFNATDSTVNLLFERAYQLHIDNIGRSQSQEAYHDAVAGFINIAYGWLSEKQYALGLIWAERVGTLVEEYRARYADDKAYIDKQWARYKIFSAVGLEGLGRMKEAAEAYASYLETQFAHTIEGRVDGSDYLSMAGHWKEAAESLSDIDKIFASEQVSNSLEGIQRNWLKKYQANYMAGRRDTANAVANEICQLLDSAIIKSQWTDAEEQETIRQQEEEILQQQKHIAHTRMVNLVFVILLLFIAFGLYTVYRHIVQRHLATANAQLEQKNAQLLLANARAEESAKMKSDFIQQISHEIRTPLNILSGFTQVVTTPGMELDDETRQDINRQITENTERITSLVNKMLELSDANSQTVLERTDQVPAIQIAAQAVENSGIGTARHLAFDLQMEPEAESSILLTNLAAATRALALLLDNAQKFTLPPEASRGGEQAEKMGQAVLKVAAREGRTLFVVEDTGIGIPADEAEHIFEEFVQLNEYYDGTGIGLTVARSLARRLGGDICLDTSYTGGARFVMHLPA